MRNHHRMVAAARQLRGETQQELADRLTKITGEEWDRNSVASIENGRRKFTVPDLLAMAEAQDMEIGWYLEPPRVASPATRPFLRRMPLEPSRHVIAPVAA